MGDLPYILLVKKQQLIFPPPFSNMAANIKELFYKNKTLHRYTNTRVWGKQTNLTKVKVRKTEWQRRRSGLRSLNVNVAFLLYTETHKVLDSTTTLCTNSPHPSHHLELPFKPTRTSWTFKFLFILLSSF